MYNEKRLLAIIFTCILVIVVTYSSSHAYAFIETDFPHVRWSPDGKLLAVSNQENILLYTDNLKISDSLKGHEKTVTALSWKPDSSLLATGSNDTTIRIWNTQNLKTVSIYRAHSEAIMGVVWSPDGNSIASISAGEKSGDNPSFQIFEPISNTYKYKFDTDIYETGGVKPLIWAIAWSADSQHLAGANQFRGVGIWNTQSKKIALTIATDYSLRDLAWSPDGQQIAVAGGSTGKPGHFSIWNTTTGRIQAQIEGHTTWVKQVAWSPDGKTIATASGDQTVQVWDPSTGKSISKLLLSNPEPSVWPNSISWSPDSKRLALTTTDNKLCIWDIQSKKNPTCVEIGNQ